MTIHVLNGDALADQLASTTVPGAFIPCRECLVEGPCAADAPELFWRQRAAFLQVAYGVEPEAYTQQVRNVLEPLRTLPPHTDLCLWFEHDLFCQANLWFILSLLRKAVPGISVYRVFPPGEAADDPWAGFGRATAHQLEKAFGARTRLSEEDIAFGARLWEAFAHDQMNHLQELAATARPAFPCLKTTVQAHCDRFPAGRGLPERFLAKQLEAGITGFPHLFAAFSKELGVYGFGDLQVKRLLAAIMKGGAG